MSGIRILLILILTIFVSQIAYAESLSNSGVVVSSSALLDASSANYFPSSSGHNINDYESFGYEIMCDDASGDAIGVTVTVQTSYDGTNWVTATQNYIFPSTAAATASLSITTDGGYYHGSIHPCPAPMIRLVLTEGSAQADVTATVKVFLQ